MNLKQRELVDEKGHRYSLSTSSVPGDMLGTSHMSSSPYNNLIRKILVSPFLTEEETSPES